MQISLVAIHQDPNTQISLASMCLKSYARADPAVREQCRFSLHDYHVDDSPSRVLTDVLGAQPDLIGFSLYLWNVKACVALAGQVKAARPGVTIVFGGPEVDAETLQRFDCTPVDFLIVGEGEVPFRSLCAMLLASGHGAGISWPAGLVEKRGGKFQWDGRIAITPDLAEAPSPYLDGDLPRTSGHLYWETARGCRFRCQYCHYNRHSPKVRQFPFERLAAELSLFQRLGVPRVYVIDPTFNANPSRAKKILHTIIELNPSTHYHVELRADLLDEETASLLAPAHVEYVEVGLQSSNPGALSEMIRPTRLDRFVQGIERLHKHGIFFEVQLIAGLPGDNYDSFKRSVDFGLSLNPPAMSAFPLLLLPGTAFRRRAKELGIRFQEDPPYGILECNGFLRSEVARAVELGRTIPVALEYARYTLRYLMSVCEVAPSKILERLNGWNDVPEFYTRLAGLTREVLDSDVDSEMLLKGAMAVLALDIGFARARDLPELPKPGDGMGLEDPETTYLSIAERVIVMQADFDLEKLDGLSRADLETALVPVGYVVYRRFGRSRTLRLSSRMAVILEEWRQPTPPSIVLGRLASTAGVTEPSIASRFNSFCREMIREGVLRACAVPVEG